MVHSFARTSGLDIIFRFRHPCSATERLIAPRWQPIGEKMNQDRLDDVTDETSALIYRPTKFPRDTLNSRSKGL